MGGFIKGIVVGVASFAAGFALLAVILPPSDAPEPEAQTQATPEPVAEVQAEVEPEEAAPDDPVEAEAEAEEAAPEVVEAAEEPIAEAVEEASDEAVVETTEETAEETTLEPVAEAPEDAAEALATEAPVEPNDEPAAEMPEAEVIAEAESDGAVAETEEAIEETSEESPAPAETALDATAEGAPPATGHEAAPDNTTADAPESFAQGPAEDLPEPATEPAAPVLRAVPPAPPQPGLNRVVEGVTTGRLPAIGAETENGAAATDAPAEATVPAPEAEIDADLPAYRRFAAAYDPPPGLPLFGIILIDAPLEGAPEPAAEAALLALPFAVSVALDPADADAPRRAAAYRQAGHEVLILAEGLPRAAQPSDIEVTLEGWLRALPEAVGLLDTPEGAIQGDRPLAQRLAPALAGRGLALVMPERGLNPAQQSARSAGLAHATVFRILDADEENPFTIRRYLDRATFRAQQEGQVLVLGHAARADTLDGLIGWRMEGRAGQVALVPASATLQEP